MPGPAEYPDLSGFPDDVTPAELAGLILGRPIVREGVVVVAKLELTDEQVEAILADAGIELDDER